MDAQNQIINDMPKGLIAWLQFNIEDKILYIGDKSDSLAEFLLSEEDRRKVKAVFVCERADIDSLLDKDSRLQFDKIFSVEDIELVKQPEAFIKKLSTFLAPSGRLFIGANNRLAIRYFCGDRDKYTARNFDGIENYRRYAVKKEDVLSGRMYDKAELKNMLEAAGFSNHKFYSVFPTIEYPSMIYADEYVPNEELNIRILPLYNYPDTVFLEEEFLYNDLIKNGMFHTMANAFLIECCRDDNQMLSNIEQVTLSIDRGRKDALFTIIRADKTVEKKAVYDEGVERLTTLVNHGDDLRRRGIKVVDAVLEGDSYKMPFVESETALSYLRRLAKSDRDGLIRAVDRFYNTVMKSSETYMAAAPSGKTRKEIMYFCKGYIDLVPLNCFAVNDEFVFYDQEFAIEDCPVAVLIVRVIDIIYGIDYELELDLPRSFFFERYGILDEVEEARRIGHKFIGRLRKEDELILFHNRHRRNYETVHSNRQRMNYSEEEYQQRFVDIFKNLGDRRLVLFGSGRFTKRFVAMYGRDYDIAAIIDNSEVRWGEKVDGIEIKPPEYLNELPRDSFKVLICIKSYLSVAKQLESMGITDYGIFDSSRSYSRRVNVSVEGVYKSSADTAGESVQTAGITARASEDDQGGCIGGSVSGCAKKKYKVGYVAGVFDMFHVGHVNLLRRAKEQCEYLIVGVVSDNDVYRQKEKYPVIPCEDRIEVIKACRYADRVEELPEGYGGIRDAYRMYQFDAQFSGDDHGDDQGWLADKEYLNKQGVDIVFFDYTQKVSSTKLREKLSNKNVNKKVGE